ncbi:copper chaperone PCu(A)C [Novosphingobium lentum]|uniref:copper chaperone PCu(A)C n=1 Tax=Novosphingobium lentum TaxID=145287 RepID=UPI000A999CBC|nr:copper chaperone PCu(A)C [Novosphingobium lentum]
MVGLGRGGMARLGLVAVLPLAMALASCGKKAPDAPSAPASQGIDETPSNAPGIALTGAVVKLPLVGGRPGVAYFTISQGNGAPRKLVGVHIDGVGRTEMHQSKTVNRVSSMDPVSDVPLGAGKSIAFAPGGYHVMLFDIAPTLKPGTEAELTITLDDGDKATIKAKVETADFGTGAGGMSASGMSASGMAMDHM